MQTPGYSSKRAATLWGLWDFPEVRTAQMLDDKFLQELFDLLSYRRESPSPVWNTKEEDIRVVHFFSYYVSNCPIFLSFTWLWSLTCPSVFAMSTHQQMQLDSWFFYMREEENTHCFFSNSLTTMFSLSSGSISIKDGEEKLWYTGWYLEPVVT